MRYLIKFALITLLTIGCLFNYRVFDMVKAKDNMPSNPVALMSFKEINYYQNPFNKDDYLVFVYIGDNVYFTHTDWDTVRGFLIVGEIILPSNDIFTEIKLIPWWLYVIAFLIIFFFPKFKKKEKERGAALVNNVVKSDSPSEIAALRKEVKELSEVAALKKEIQELKNQIKNNDKTE